MMGAYSLNPFLAGRSKLGATLRPLVGDPLHIVTLFVVQYLLSNLFFQTYHWRQLSVV